MIKVGITGGIGSGKSTVCRVFELLGVPVYYSDAEAKTILDADPEVNAAVLKLFGAGVKNEAGMIDRKKIAAIVFTEKDKLEKLNSIVHPAVGKHFDDWCKKNADAPFILKEAAILYESGAYKQVDKVIVVTAPEALKIERLQKRDGLSTAEIRKRINSQMSDAEKTGRADFVIANDEQSLLIPQVVSLYGQLTNAK